MESVQSGDGRHSVTRITECPYLKQYEQQAVCCTFDLPLLLRYYGYIPAVWGRNYRIYYMFNYIIWRKFHD